MSNIQKIQTKKFTWINIVNANKENLKYLKKEFNFDSLDLAECLPNLQRPKINEHENYIFIVLQFPFYERDIKTIESEEIDFFISKNYLITIHNGELSPLVDFFNLCQTDPMIKSQINDEKLSFILYKILNKLYNYCYPVLNQIDLEISEAEKNILGDAGEKTIKHILLIKRNIVDYQKIMQSHFHILQKFIELSNKFRYSKGTKNYYYNLINYTKDIWDYLKNYKDTINALHETQESITNLKINEVMKTLTIFSVVVFPLTLLASIFGMNTMNSMPFINSQHDFWYIIIIMLIGTIIMFVFFKKKRLL